MLLFIFLLILSKSTVSKKKNTSRNTIRVPNSLDPDQTRHVVGSDLGPNSFSKVITVVGRGSIRGDEEKARHLVSTVPP